MLRRKRVLLISASVILLCMTIIVGMTYALFSDVVSVGNHLKAGNLDVQLWRTNLKYSVLDAEGYLDETTVETDVNFTTSTKENVFGITSDDVKIAPGAYFDAELQVKNKGNVAFDYYVTLNFVKETNILGNIVSQDDEAPNTLAKQLNVTIYQNGEEGTEPTILFEGTLDTIKGKQIYAGHLAAGDEDATFCVLVEFIDDVEYNSGVDTSAGEKLMDNDAAQQNKAVFDLIVTAIQATDKPGA